ncbi:MAG: haloacid dehalogenase type II [Bacteroidota bacterium]
MIKVCVFDAFGTLFQLDLPVDVATNKTALEALKISRQKQLEYSWLYSQMGKYLPFEKITMMAIKYAVKKVGLKDITLSRKLKTIFLTPNYYDDVVETVRELKTSGIRCGILSNGSGKMLSEVIKYTGLVDAFDFVLSAEDVKTFKPSPLVYGIALHHLRIPKEQILFVSSNQWDISGANAFGFKTAWINRSDSLREPILDSAETIILKKLSSIPETLNEFN